MEDRPLSRRQLAGLLASVGATLASIALTFFLSSLTNAAPGILDPVPVNSLDHGVQGELDASESLTPTIFLPAVSRFERINFWSAEYYDNSTLTGVPVIAAGEQAIDCEWEEGSPPGLPPNQFSARWTGDWAFDGGEYTFFIYGDDGVRFWLDESLVLDRWTPGMGAYQVTTAFGQPGVHGLKLEYFEQSGQAAVRLHWRRSDVNPPWDGKYYANPWLEGNPSYEDPNSAIQFDWGSGAPDGLPINAFSVDWSASPVFPGGTHEIFVYADEGYQPLVDGDIVQEGGWLDGQDGGAEDDSYDLDTAASERVEIAYRVHDRGGPAEARLWIVSADQAPWTAEYYANRNLTGPPVRVDA
ncbi:PA14 domain-containing protein, partial [Chloroflexota bacterium]